MEPLFGVIADDLTGGMETAAMLVAAGIDCAFVTDAEAVSEIDSAEAIVVAQKTRVVAAEEAVARSKAAAQALLARGARQIFFKYCATFDSTDRGNIGPVADMLMQVTGAAYTGFCPSAPDLSRTVYNGHLFYGAQLISESPKRHDPLTPMTDPDLVRVLQRQTRVKVGLLAYPSVQAGEAVLKGTADALAQAGMRYFIIDAIDEAHLDTIAALTCDWPLMTGNATLVRHYPRHWRDRGMLPLSTSHQKLPAVPGAGVVLAGSCAERTLEQLADFEKFWPVLYIDLATADGAETVVERALAWARPRLEAGPVAIATSGGPDMVEAVQARHGKDAAAKLAEDILGGLAVALHRSGVRRFAVAGGETSGAVVKRLGIRSLRIGSYGGPGIGTAVTEGTDPIALCLKSGKLGPIDLFTRALDTMRTGGTA